MTERKQNMKKTDALIGGPVYAVYMFFSCLVVMCAEILAIKIVNLFILPSPLTLCVIRAFIYTVGVNVILAIVSYREGYKAGHYSIVGTLISGIIATLLHFVFCLLFSFEAFCAGGVKFMAALIKFGSSLNSESFVGKLDRFDLIPYFLINSAVYIGIMILFGKLGERRRLFDRSTLQGSETISESK